MSGKPKPQTSSDTLPKLRTTKKVRFADEERPSSGSGSNASTLSSETYELFDATIVDPKNYLHSFGAYIRAVQDSGTKKSIGEIIDAWLNACFEACEEAATVKRIEVYRNESVVDSKPLNPLLSELGDTVPVLWEASHKEVVANSSYEFTGDTKNALETH